MSSFDDSGEVPVVSPAQMMPVQVLRREVIAPDVVTLFLVLPDTEQAPAPYLPGQFVTLALPTTQLPSQFATPALPAPRRTLYRSYSLCGDGRPDQPWEITIKRIREGAVSTYLYEAVEEGSLLYSSLPRGTFTLPANLQSGTPLVFVAVGSGITPIMGMLSALALLPPQQRPQVQLHYASRSLHEMIYRGELQQLDRQEYWLRRWFYLSSDGNRMTPEVVLVRAREVALQAHWYTCVERQ
jgi:ferredoxin-NADP reductase